MQSSSVQSSSVQSSSVQSSSVQSSSGGWFFFVGLLRSRLAAVVSVTTVRTLNRRKSCSNVFWPGYRRNDGKRLSCLSRFVGRKIRESDSAKFVLHSVSPQGSVEECGAKRLEGRISQRRSPSLSSRGYRAGATEQGLQSRGYRDA